MAWEAESINVKFYMRLSITIVFKNLATYFALKLPSIQFLNQFLKFLIKIIKTLGIS